MNIKLSDTKTVIYEPLLQKETLVVWIDKISHYRFQA